MIPTESKLYRAVVSILETILINLIIYVFFYLRPANQNIYLFLNPHPLLFLAMAMGLRYGIQLGTVSSIISCSFYIYTFYQLYDDFSLLINNFQYYKYPLLFLWIAFIFGAFRDNNKRKQKDKDEQIQILTKENYNLEKDFETLDKIQQELKKQIIGADDSIISLYDIATKLETFETEDIYTETIGVLKKYLHVTNVSLYAFDKVNNYLRLKITYGDVEDDKNSIDAANCTWFEKVNNEKQVVKFISKSKNDNLPLMSAPLIRNGELIAVINIKGMKFDMISEYAFQLFQLIIDWINRALDKATYVENLLETVYIENTKLVTAPFFKKRIEIERRRKYNFGMDYCLLAYRVKNLDIKEIDTLVQKTLRPVDIAYYNIKNNTLTFLMPATKKSFSFILEDKIKYNFNDSLTKIELKTLEG
ncbi:MAG: hypothetical protein ACPKM0_05195 [Pleomorphochaeta sp.]